MAIQKLPEQQSKKWILKSKTLWANVILAAVAFYPPVAAVVTVDILAVIFPVVNLVLRLVTKDKLVLKE